MLALPAFSFNTTIVCIDDDPLMLDSLSEMLKLNHPVKRFENPQDALKFLQNYKSPLSKMTFMSGIIEHEYYDSSTNAPINLNIENLLKLPDQANRHDEISVLVIDYNLPDMNGIEFCKHLKDMPFKKILLTGELDYPGAIGAFNEKLIDCFIQKSSPTLVDDVSSYIRTLSQLYFIDCTSHLRTNLEADYALPLSDQVFVDFFNTWCLTHRIKEYFLINKNGSFFMLDDTGDKYCFVIYTDRSLNEFVKSYDEDEGVADQIKAIERREKIPFFGIGRSSEQIDPADWENCLYVPNIINGKELYYYCYVKQN